MCVGPEADNLAMITQLQDIVLLKVGSPMRPCSGDLSVESETFNFLSRHRRWTSEGILRQPACQFVSENVKLIGLQSANNTITPATKDNKDDDGEFEGDHIILYRTVVGKLMYVSEEFPEAMYQIKEQAGTRSTAA